MTKQEAKQLTEKSYEKKYSEIFERIKKASVNCRYDIQVNYNEEIEVDFIKLGYHLESKYVKNSPIEGGSTRILTISWN